MENVGTIHDRVRQLVTAVAGGKNTVFAQKLGVNEANIRGYVKNIEPKADFLDKVVRTYDVSAEWLLTGRGEMLKGQPADRGEMLKGGPVGAPSSAGSQPGGAERPLSAHGEAPAGVHQGGPSSSSVPYGAPIDTTDRVSECGPSTGSFAPDIHVGTTATTPAPTGSSPAETSAHLISEATTPTAEGIPLIPTEAIAAALAGDLSVTATAPCDRYVVPLFQDADFLIPVKGSSMHPHYGSGDIVACRRIPLDGLFFQWGKVYVLLTPQGALVKRVKPGTDPAHVLIVSDNPSFDPFELPTSALRAVALVVGVLRQE